MEITGCVVAVTGGASGLGEATIRDFVAHGAKGTIIDLDAERGEKIAEELGSSAIFCHTDITDEEAVRSALERTVTAFGGLHVAVNCAGVGIAEKVLSKRGTMPIENFNKVVQLNLVGTMNVIRLAAERMLENAPNDDGEKGVFVNTASAAAFEGTVGQAAYSASKAGVVGMTLPIAREFAGYGFRVVTVAPGLFLTPMMQAVPDKALEALSNSVPFPKRLGKPAEFAQLAREIVLNPMLNGCTIRLDGALRMDV